MVAEPKTRLAVSNTCRTLPVAPSQARLASTPGGLDRCVDRRWARIPASGDLGTEGVATRAPIRLAPGLPPARRGVRRKPLWHHGSLAQTNEQRERFGRFRVTTSRRFKRAGASVQDWNASVGVAQLVRAPGCGPGGRGFKSPRSPPRGLHVSVRARFTFGPWSTCQRGAARCRFRVGLGQGAARTGGRSSRAPSHRHQPWPRRPWSWRSCDNATEPAVKELGYRVIVSYDVVFALHTCKRAHLEERTGVAGAVEAASPRHSPFAGALGAVQTAPGYPDLLVSRLTSDVLAA